MGKTQKQQTKSKKKNDYIINALLTTLSELWRHLPTQKSKALEYVPAKWKFWAQVIPKNFLIASTMGKTELSPNSFHAVDKGN